MTTFNSILVNFNYIVGFKQSNCSLFNYRETIFDDTGKFAEDMSFWTGEAAVLVDV